MITVFPLLFEQDYVIDYEQLNDVGCQILTIHALSSLYDNNIVPLPNAQSKIDKWRQYIPSSYRGLKYDNETGKIILDGIHTDEVLAELFRTIGSLASEYQLDKLTNLVLDKAINLLDSIKGDFGAQSCEFAEVFRLICGREVCEKVSLVVQSGGVSVPVECYIANVSALDIVKIKAYAQIGKLIKYIKISMYLPAFPLYRKTDVESVKDILSVELSGYLP